MNTTRLPCVNILCKVCKNGGNITLMVHHFEIQVERICKTNIHTPYEGPNYHPILKYVYETSMLQMEFASSRRHSLEEK